MSTDQLKKQQIEQDEYYTDTEKHLNVEKVLVEDKLRSNNLIQFIISLIYIFLHFAIGLTYTIFLFTMNSASFIGGTEVLMKICMIGYLIIICVLIIFYMVTPPVLCRSLTKDVMTLYFVLEMILFGLTIFMTLGILVSWIAQIIPLVAAYSSTQLTFFIVVSLVTVVILAVSVCEGVVIGRALWMKFKFEKKFNTRLSNLSF